MRNQSDGGSVSSPSIAEMEEMYDRAYRDWQAVSLALLGREHANREDLLAEIHRLKQVPA